MNKDEFYDEFNHFCKCIDFQKTFLDARAIKFMNEFTIMLDDVIKNG